MYKVLKPIMGTLIAIVSLALLLLPMVIIGIIIKIDSPGPVFFKQKRIGKGGSIYTLLKFRSMPTNVPHDTPTHEFKASDCLSPWQRFIRRSSIDELPQLFNIVTQKMSIVGPRPALWNQDDLVAERDKYGANDIRPGLTGLAQISGRDELEIPVKARLDGKYAQTLKKGGFSAFAMDIRCIFGTVKSVVCHDGVVEGGTGAMAKEKTEEMAKEPVGK